jgi:WD40 repeat protein/predicted Ser/Thr protein kinase
MADLVGQQFGNYRLQRLLGEGGFSQVYLGEHIHLGSLAAIKVLHNRLGQEDQENFRSEARTIVRLKHPNIVRLLEFGIEGSTPFLVMDYAPGGTLRQRHPRSQPLPLATILPYVRNVADALQYAHDQKLIHRDIKPENMLLGERGEVLLSDFGIATVAQSSRYPSTREVAGTAAYMAPEQFQGHPRPASDQYALGIVVYEWLTGTRPFHGSFLEISGQHLHTPPPPLHEKLPGISPAVEQVLLTALEKDPQQRFASMQAFANALEQASGIVTPTVYPSGALPPPSLPNLSPNPPQQANPSASNIYYAPTQRTPSSPGQLPTIAVPSDRTPGRLSRPLEDAGMGWQPMSSGPAGTPPFVSSVDAATVLDRPPFPPETPPGKLSRRTILAAGIAGLVVAVGGSAAVLALSQKRQGPTDIVQSTTQGSPPPTRTPPPPTAPSTPAGTLLYKYRGHIGTVFGVAISPNNQRIASSGADRTVQVWDAVTGSDSFLYRGHTDAVTAVAWSPDGQRIASASYDDTVQVWEVATGNRLVTYHGHSDQVLAVAWSPDGHQITSAGKDMRVHVWESSTGNLRIDYRGHTDTVTTIAWSPDGQRIASGSWDKTVQLWDSRNGMPLGMYYGHSDHVWAVGWSPPDGGRLASGSKDETAQVWDATTRTTLLTYRGHVTRDYTGAVFALVWSPDGKHIASGSRDTTVQIWDASNGSRLLTYQGHTGALNAVAWSSYRQRLASGSDDGTVQVWQAP